MKHKASKMVLTLLVFAMILATSALAATVSNTVKKTDTKTVSISSSPEEVSVTYDYGGPILPGDDASIFGYAKTTSTSSRYVRVYGKFSEYSNKYYDKTQTSATGNLNVSGQTTLEVDTGIGSGYSEVRSGTTSTGSIIQKVELTITN